MPLGLVKDWRIPGSTKQLNLRPRMEIVNENDKVLKLANGSKAIYELPVSAVLSINFSPGKKNKKVSAGDLLARIPLDFQKSKDITGGLPRVAELFEARKPKDYSYISDIRGKVEFGNDVRANKKLIVVDTENTENQVEYLVPKGKHIMVQEGDVVFPTRPVLQVEANLIEAQIIETILLNLLNFQTLIATKASRMRLTLGSPSRSKRLWVSSDLPEAVLISSGRLERPNGGR